MKTQTITRNSNLEFRNNLGFLLYHLIKLKIIQLYKFSLFWGVSAGWGCGG